MITTASLVLLAASSINQVPSISIQDLDLNHYQQRQELLIGVAQPLLSTIEDQSDSSVES